MASPAEIANDMDAHARFWAGRDRDAERACRDAARAIRDLLAGKRLDGRFWGGLHGRLLRLERLETMVQGYPDFLRARLCIERLRLEARAA
ncbi:hypothetical protein KZZ07_19605 [Mameliella sp. CS4]|uniref:hypothetical protein n=1 Tax=Mameliella sp. CS4 TaxID=2862329 RepID=UPI001C5D139A|nr:hypothetical protein [Mameliella sp. CS4]MBW4984750.1 hypothetical protein [Mameliella sp. CS4]